MTKRCYRHCELAKDGWMNGVCSLSLTGQTPPHPTVFTSGLFFFLCLGLEILISRLCRMMRLLLSTQNSLRRQEELVGGVWSEQREPELRHTHQHTAENRLFHVEAHRGKIIFLNIHLPFWVWPAVHKSHDQLSVMTKITLKWDWRRPFIYL